MEGKRHPAPPSIIVETPTTINRTIRRKHYFFYEIIKDGILLHDDGMFQIDKPEKLPYREIKQYAEEENTFEDNEVLREVAIREYAARIAYYNKMIEEEEKDKI